MRGMTIKQFARARFWQVLEAYAEACKPGADKTNFVALSIAMHQAKNGVPKSLWPLVNRAYRGEL